LPLFPFFALAIAALLTHRLQIDEGLLASPALRLATKDFFRTTIFKTEKSFRRASRKELIGFSFSASTHSDGFVSSRVDGIGNDFSVESARFVLL
jgi:hypothetical protein